MAFKINMMTFAIIGFCLVGIQNVGFASSHYIFKYSKDSDSGKCTLKKGDEEGFRYYDFRKLFRKFSKIDDELTKNAYIALLGFSIDYDSLRSHDGESNPENYPIDFSESAKRNCKLLKKFGNFLNANLDDDGGSEETAQLVCKTSNLKILMKINKDDQDSNIKFQAIKKDSDKKMTKINGLANLNFVENSDSCPHRVELNQNKYKMRLCLPSDIESLKEDTFTSKLEKIALKNRSGKTIILKKDSDPVEMVCKAESSFYESDELNSIYNETSDSDFKNSGGDDFDGSEDDSSFNTTKVDGNDEFDGNDGLN